MTTADQNIIGTQVLICSFLVLYMTWIFSIDSSSFKLLIFVPHIENILELNGGGRKSGAFTMAIVRRLDVMQTEEHVLLWASCFGRIQRQILLVGVDKLIFSSHSVEGVSLLNAFNSRSH